MQVIADVDEENRRSEARLQARINELTALNQRLADLLAASTALCARHTAAMGFLASRLASDGMPLAEIERVTCGLLKLESP